MAMIKRCDFSDKLICNSVPLCFRSNRKHIKYYRGQFIKVCFFLLTIVVASNDLLRLAN